MSSDEVCVTPITHKRVHERINYRSLAAKMFEIDEKNNEYNYEEDEDYQEDENGDSPSFSPDFGSTRELLY